MTGMLASINSLQEARLIENLAIDIIDLKQPAQGALGALPATTIRQIVEQVGPHNTLSATIGDLPMQPDIILDAIKTIGDTGVDYVKMGFFPADDYRAVLSALADISQQYRLIAVLFADTQPDLSIIQPLAETGFKGVMLDTMDKNCGSLTDVMSMETIRLFVSQARQNSLLTGLAGSLRARHIEMLMPLKPDYLGFRGALCQQHQRQQHLDVSKAKALQSRFHTDTVCC